MFLFCFYFLGDENCDLFKGQWVPDLNGSLYTNLDCQTIPDSKNCFKNGRRERDFVNWRWKPQQCELARFDPKTFLQIVRGKKMAFIGDSVARNHVESLLCLLSKVALSPFLVVFIINFLERFSLILGNFIDCCFENLFSGTLL